MGGSDAPSEGHVAFWRVAEPFLAREGVTKSTMMGFPCIRVNGAFCACVHKDGTGLVAKLPAARVEAAVAAGEGEAFAPAGKVFREWLFVPVAAVDTWPAWLAESFAFVTP